MDVTESHYDSVDSTIDFVSFQNLFKGTVCYLAEVANKSEVDLGFTLDETGPRRWLRTWEEISGPAEFKNSGTAMVIQTLIPGLKLKTVKKMCSGKPCGVPAFWLTPMKFVQMRCTFLSEYGDGGEISTEEEEHTQGRAEGDFGRAYGLNCYETSKYDEYDFCPGKWPLTIRSG
eukprot:TRINITY_DN6535_c0_g1_i1.p1 TRINITY_DN6535_c0_g1~~TRINITY_DN6535_c0_g1_i1.p1  ORF type:complete len:174 (-),score=25.27 TRINITY_DN6535_c0_g1_i1:84-605(-)